MSFQKAGLVLCALGVLTLVGCVTATSPSSAGVAAAVAAPSPHEPPMDVVIYIDVASDGTSTVTPETAYLDSPAQRIQWISNAPDFVLTFEAPALPAKALPAVSYVKGKGRATLTNVPAKVHTGKHAYTVSILKASTGEAVKVDPIIIVTY